MKTLFFFFFVDFGICEITQFFANKEFQIVRQNLFAFSLNRTDVPQVLRMFAINFDQMSRDQLKCNNNGIES